MENTTTTGRKRLILLHLLNLLAWVGIGLVAGAVLETVFGPYLDRSETKQAQRAASYRGEPFDS